MKICFPIESDRGLESDVFGHFGSAPYFIVLDTETQATETIDNQDANHIHGQCSPIKALNGKRVDAIVVGGIGRGAIQKLNSLSVKVYQAIQGTVQTNIEAFGATSEITIAHACDGHRGGCGH